MTKKDRHKALSNPYIQSKGAAKIPSEIDRAGIKNYWLGDVVCHCSCIMSIDRGLCIFAPKHQCQMSRRIVTIHFGFPSRVRVKICKKVDMNAPRVPNI